MKASFSEFQEIKSLEELIRILARIDELIKELHGLLVFEDIHIEMWADIPESEEKEKETS